MSWASRKRGGDVVKWMDNLLGKLSEKKLKDLGIALKKPTD